MKRVHQPILIPPDVPDETRASYQENLRSMTFDNADVATALAICEGKQK